MEDGITSLAPRHFLIASVAPAKVEPRPGRTRYFSMPLTPCTRRSDTGYVFILHGGAITWLSNRQPSVVASTTESKWT